MDKDWIYGMRGAFPAAPPVVVCAGCKRRRSAISIYTHFDGRRLCWHCIRSEKASAT